jgi:hypothetical protein
LRAIRLDLSGFAEFRSEIRSQIWPRRTSDETAFVTLRASNDLLGANETTWAATRQTSAALLNAADDLDGL